MEYGSQIRSPVADLVWNLDTSLDMDPSPGKISGQSLRPHSGFGPGPGQGQSQG